MLIAASFLLHGCNVYEHAAESDWQDVGKKEPPTTDLGGLLITPLSSGHGPTVQAGDLVRVRVYSQKRGLTTREMFAPDPVRFEAWLWTGRGPNDDPDTPVGDWAYLGATPVRTSLIGKAVGERFRIGLPEGTRRATFSIPVYGLTTGNRNEYSIGRYSERQWPFVDLPEDENGHSWGDIEILERCDGRLLRRTATLTQWGPVLNMFDSYYPTSRLGVLGWTALEASCAPPRGKVRFEVGPLYDQVHQLLDWDVSYASAHQKNQGLHISVVISFLVLALSFGLARLLRSGPPRIRPRA